MSMTMDDSIKRWTAKRKTALVVEINPEQTRLTGSIPLSLRGPAGVIVGTACGRSSA